MPTFPPQSALLWRCEYQASLGTGLWGNLQVLYFRGSLWTWRRLEWLSQLHFLPSQGSLKHVTEIGFVVPAVLLAIQQLPWGGPINHICSLSSIWLARKTAGRCLEPLCVYMRVSVSVPWEQLGTKFSCNKRELVAAFLITIIHPTSSKEMTVPRGDASSWLEEIGYFSPSLTGASS